MNDKKEKTSSLVGSAIHSENLTKEQQYHKWWLDEAEKNNKLILENERLKTQISNLKAVLKEVL